MYESPLGIANHGLGNDERITGGPVAMQLELGMGSWKRERKGAFGE